MIPLAGEATPISYTARKSVDPIISDIHLTYLVSQKVKHPVLDEVRQALNDLINDEIKLEIPVLTERSLFGLGLGGLTAGFAAGGQIAAGRLIGMDAGGFARQISSFATESMDARRQQQAFQARMAAARHRGGPFLSANSDAADAFGLAIEHINRRKNDATLDEDEE